MGDLTSRTLAHGVDAHAPTQLDAGEARADAPPAFPVPSWDRYSSVKFLGRGGMGIVFLAVDSLLRRQVAIKFVHGDDPSHVRRLVAEARAQARVSHERVCKVHEVGEVDGKVYIAMQHIDGKSLGEMAGELTVEQKVMLLRGAAEGIHEAHRAGIIHRDVKPSNIMVTRSEDGELRPYVMDFGLARAPQESGATLSGAVLGTPHYMAPEQARGVADLDRRVDVYSLGATLYHLLTGAPPIEGSSVMEVLHNLLTAEPRPPRALVPDLPVDLEAIVLKCLEVDRSARYDSARALADDLGRFLDGEPVLARPAGPWYRLRKWVARRRRLVAAAAVTAALLLIALGWGVQTRRQAKHREDLARRFTEKVEHIEAMARYSALSPAHDIRADRAAIRAKMAELDGEIRQAGQVAAGPGHYALGRGYLALDDDERAREQLEAAWQLGFREPRVAEALALVMGDLYKQNLLAAARIERKELREAKEREIERRYRDPALAYAAASRGADASSADYAAARVAFYRGQLDDALRHLDAAKAGQPWFYEALQLRGDILFARALALRNRGERDPALHAYQAGRQAYAAAAAVGESVPAIQESLGDLEYAAMVMELYGAGDVVPPFERAVAAATRALAIDPDRYASLLLRARARRSLAEHRANQGGALDDLLTQAIADAERAIAIAPARAEAHVELARTFRQWGEVRQAQNQDPAEQLGKAVEASERIAEADRDAIYHGNLGLIHTVWADYQGQVGADSRAHRDKAIAAYTRAIQIDDRMNDAWINLGMSYFTRASEPRAADPDRDLQQASRALDRATAINPKHVVPYFYGGEIHKLVARRERAAGGDPAPELVRSLEVFRAGLVINPRLPHLHNGIGLVLLEQAKDAWDRGQDPDPFVDQARKSFEEAIASAPDQGYGYDNLGTALATRGWFARARGRDPRPDIESAVAALNQAIERIPNHPAFWADLAMAHSIQAGYRVEQGRDPGPSLRQAHEAASKAISINAADARAQRYLADTLTMRAREDDLANAELAYKNVIDLAPEDQEHQIALGHLYTTWAAIDKRAGRDPEPILRRGLDLAEKLLAIRPSWPDAHILRASLLLERAQTTSRPEEQQDAAKRAADDFAKAIAINPALNQQWGDRAAQAQKLAAVRRDLGGADPSTSSQSPARRE
jgi:predicted Ser/Thr protein kinase